MLILVPAGNPEGMEPTATPAAKAIAARYFDAWVAGDVEPVRPLLADDIEFVGAMGVTRGVDEAIAGLAGMAGATDELEIALMVAEGDDVITRFRLVMDGAELPLVFNHMHVTDGRIDRIRVGFDPRPMFADD